MNAMVNAFFSSKVTALVCAAVFAAGTAVVTVITVNRPEDDQATRNEQIEAMHALKASIDSDRASRDTQAAQDAQDQKTAKEVFDYNPDKARLIGP